MAVRQTIQNHSPKNDVTLVLLSQGLMADPTANILDCGVLHAGEMFWPEGVAKKPIVNHRVKNISWHFCGSLERQKLSLILENFEWIWGMDKQSLRGALRALTIKKNINVLLEVNPLGEKKRVGIDSKDIQEAVDVLNSISFVKLMGFSFQVEHFMTLQDVKYGFEKTKEFFLTYKSSFKHGAILAFSCSGYLELALQMGANMVMIKDELCLESLDINKSVIDEFK